MSLSAVNRNVIVQEIIALISAREGSKALDTAAIAKKHSVTTQTIYRYLKKLEQDGRITKNPKGRENIFELTKETKEFILPLEGAAEDVAWNTHVEEFVKGTPECAYRILYYIFTEMVNNAIDHSDGTEIKVRASKNEYRTIFSIIDNGVGIFNKIAKALNLPEKRFAILELSKGKFTTNPESHTGEGIFFSSKAADIFYINSDGLSFASNVSYDCALDIISDYMIWDGPNTGVGTNVSFKVNHNHSKPLKAVFDEFADSSDDLSFEKTTVPVRLLEYANDNPLFISRSQAKRLLARFEEFKDIILDFSDIDMIGQGFADEVFRVFPANHPGSKLTPVNCNESVRQMIARVSAK